MTELPEAFKEKMKNLLGTEYEAFLESYEKERVQGLRLNPGKTDEKEFLAKVPFHLTKIPWAREGYYYDSRTDRGNIHTTRRGCITFRSPAPWQWWNFWIRSRETVCWISARRRGERPPR